jgi:hypothetical protein
MMPENVQRIATVGMDWGVLAVLAAAVMITSLSFGLVPALTGPIASWMFTASSLGWAPVWRRADRGTQPRTAVRLY